MKYKKNPQRFSIQFDPSIPEHRAAIDILEKKGRFAARYIAETIAFYESAHSNTLEATVTDVVTKMLGLSSMPLPINNSVNSQTMPSDYDDIISDLEGFKK